DEQEHGELALSLDCYMKENIGSTREDALKYITSLVDSCLQELKWEFFKSLDIPKCCRNLYFNVATRVKTLFQKLKFMVNDAKCYLVTYNNKLRYRCVNETSY
ncbi:hypothetical protein KI387_021695, partial [Taxus chinensis]